jgi:CRP/FNR family transcriptional regulator
VSDAKGVNLDLLTEEEQALMRQNRIDTIYKKGEMICKNGTFAPHVIHLRSGLAKVFIENGSESLILKIIPPGNIIGLTSIMEGNNVFHYSAMAYEDSEVCLIDINTFRQVIRQNAAFATSIINIFCENSLQIYNRFFCFTNKQLYGRLADILLCLSERIFNQETFTLNISRKELAELTGMSTESVIRMLKKLKHDGIIGMEKKNISIINFDLLKQISAYG